MAKARLSELKSAALEKEPAVDGESPREQWKKKYHRAVRKDGYQVIIASIMSVNYEEASRRLEEFETRFPEVGFYMASTLGPNENRNYAIEIGTGLSHDDATELRNWAVRNGLPTDTYIVLQDYRP
jgi:hypothetical protein